MLNRTELQGRLTHDPELKTTQGGVSVCSFRLAVEGDIKDRNTGERKTEFFTIVTWRNTAEFVSKYLSKGRMVIIDGKLHNKEYTDRDGKKRYVTEIHAENVYFADSKKEEGQQTRQTTVPVYQKPAATPARTQVIDTGEDEELPF